jgi:hypothetical protein
LRKSIKIIGSRIVVGMSWRRRKMEQQLIMREGKTARDHGNGSWGNRFENRSKRVSWQKGDLKAFPKETCNGKKNRLNR